MMEQPPPVQGTPYNAGYDQPGSGSTVTSPPYPVFQFNPGQAGQQPWVVMASPPTVYPNYQHRQSIAFGIVLIVAGAVSFLCHVVALAVAQTDHSGVGFWCGAMCIVTGSFGIVTGNKKTKCWIVSFLIMSILTAVACLLQVILSITLGILNDEYYYHGEHWHMRELFSVGLAMHSLMLVAALGAGIIAILASTLCCKLYCCGNNTNNTYGVPFQTAAFNGQIAYVPAATGGANYLQYQVVAQQPAQRPPQYEAQQNDNNQYDQQKN